MSEFQEDKILKSWKKYGFPKDFCIDRAIKSCEDLIERRKLAGMNSPKQFFNSIEQLEIRLKWLKTYKRLKDSPLWRILNEQA